MKIIKALILLLLVSLSFAVNADWGRGWEASNRDSACLMLAYYSHQGEVPTPADGVTLSFSTPVEDSDLPRPLKNAGYKIGQSLFFTHFLEYPKGRGPQSKIKKVSIAELRLKTVKWKNINYFYLDSSESSILLQKLKTDEDVFIVAIDEDDRLYEIHIGKAWLNVAEAMMESCSIERTRNKRMQPMSD